MKCQNMIVYLRKLVSPSTHWCKLFPQHCHWHSLYSILTCSWLMKCCHTHGAPLGPFTHLALSTPQLYASSSMLSSSFSGDWRPFWFFYISLFLFNLFCPEWSRVAGRAAPLEETSTSLCRSCWPGCCNSGVKEDSSIWILIIYFLFSLLSQSKHFNELYIFIILT